MSAEPPDRMGIAELAARAGVTARTVRYYVAEGLLPRPEGEGQQRVYTAEHLRRLEAIARLKEAYLPLAEIRRRLAELPPADLERLVDMPPAPPGSALDYLAAIRQPDRPIREPRASRPAAPVQPVAWLGPSGSSRSTLSPGFAAPGQPSDEELWRRVVLAPGVELHYQPTGDRRRDETIAHVIRAARQLLDSG